jgi:hypothetical protein
MKASVKVEDKAYVPRTITITFESPAEEELFKNLMSYTETVPNCIHSRDKSIDAGALSNLMGELFNVVK